MRRRELNAALALTAAFGPLALSAKTLPKDLLDIQPALKRWGTGEFSRFGFSIYEATLWAGENGPLQPPLALSLTYERSIKGQAIAEASADEMRRFGASDADLARWESRMLAMFPDVKEGDQLIGLHLPDRARFYFNGQSIGEVAGVEFAQSFFAIWLNPRTSEPRLRTALLKRAS